MHTLDLTQVPPAQWGEALTGALNAINANRTPVEAIDRDAQLRTLRSREQELLRDWQRLMADLNDVRERMRLLEDARYTRFPKEVV